MVHSWDVRLLFVKQRLLCRASEELTDACIIAAFGIPASAAAEADEACWASLVGNFRGIGSVGGYVCSEFSPDSRLCLFRFK